MFEMILLCIGLTLAMIGIGHLMARVRLFLFRPSCPAYQTAVIFLDGLDDEKQVTYYLERYKWYGDGFAESLVFIGRDEPPYALRRLAQSNDRVFFGKIDEIQKLVCEAGEIQWGVNRK